MNKIAIVSCYFQPNYGSMLQAYATQEILNQLEVPNETINIEGLRGEIKKAKMNYFMSRIFSWDVIQDKLGYVKIAFEKKKNKELAGNISKRNQLFDEFSKRVFNVSEQYSSLKQLGEASKKYSAFLVGSDQLWLPSNIAADYYTLNFVDPSVRKISYATSFGVSALPKKQADIAKQFLPKINYLSVREKSGQKLIKSLTGLDAELVCDPTLLLTRQQWDNLIENERIIKEPYIFCYFLGDNQLSRKCAAALRKKTGYKIVALQQIDMFIKSDEGFADIAPYDIDPAGFVNLIRNAEFVCTDSFHGTVFSIINQKQFYTFRRFVEHTTMSTNSRIDSLLSVLGLEHRIINSQDEFKNQRSVSISYDSVDEELSSFRKKSICFLKKSIEDLE